MKEPLETMKCILSTTVTVKGRAALWAARLPCHLEGGSDELDAVLFGHLMGDYFAGK